VVEDDHGLAVVVEFGAHIMHGEHGTRTSLAIVAGKTTMGTETNDPLLVKNEVHAGTNLLCR